MEFEPQELAKVNSAKRWDARRRNIKSFLEKLIHFCLYPLVQIYAFFFIPEPSSPEAPERILVVERILRLGDTIVSLPALQTLRRKYPRATIHLLADASAIPLLQDNPNIDRLIPYDRKQGWRAFIKTASELRNSHYTHSYVLVTDVLSLLLPLLANIPWRTGYNCNNRGIYLSRPVHSPPTINRPVYAYPPGASGPPIIQLWAKLVDCTNEGLELPRIVIGRKALASVGELVSKIKRPWVLLHPGSANPSYLWLGERWRELCRRLIADGYRVVIGGSALEKALGREISGSSAPGVYDLTGRLSTPEYLALISLADAVISVDTFAGHSASALGRPLVVLFGPGDEGIWKPAGRGRIAIVAGDSPCRGCKRPECFQAKHYCMETITVDDVWRAFCEVARGK
jgi:lipopolysaccharide heptosyltransferase II